MPSHRFVQCDVFAERPLEGNALAVFTNGSGLTGDRMQAVARETNLSETVFVLPAESGGDFRVRIFTPGRELQFAGHPLLGAAVVVGRSLPLDRLTLETGVGPIAVDVDRSSGVAAAATMHQPAPAFGRHDRPQAVRDALGVGAGPVPVSDNGMRYALVALESVEQLAALYPDQQALGRVDGLDGAVCYVEDGEQVRVRVFLPWVGIAEDPGTGSAAGPLAAHLGRALTIVQGVELGRTCVISAELGDDGRPRVGGAVTLVGRGSYELP